MGLPALADDRALARWLRVSIETTDDLQRAQDYLRTASTLVRSRAGETWVDAEGNLEAVPDGISQVVVMVAARLWRNPTSDRAGATGPFSTTFGAGFELTEAEAAMVDDAMGSTSFGGIGTLSTTRGATETGLVTADPVDWDDLGTPSW